MTTSKPPHGRADLDAAAAGIIRLLPRLGELETADELGRTLRALRRVPGSRAIARDLIVAQIAFVHLWNPEGDASVAAEALDEFRVSVRRNRLAKETRARS